MFAKSDYLAVLAIAEETHFGRAARRIGCTQPSLSARLRRIEEQLGVRLFERDRGGVTLTAAGAQFVEGAERVLSAAAETDASTRAAQAGLGQTIRIGMTQVAAYQVMVPTLAAFHALQPRAGIHLIEATTATLERALERKSIDVAFLHPPVHAPGLTERELTRVSVSRFNGAPDEAAARPLIRFPRAEAPVLMGELARTAAWDGQPGGERMRPDLPEIEADTLLGALVLSRAGFGPFVAPEDYPSPFDKTPACHEQSPVGMTLVTSVVWRRLDRRPIVSDLVSCAAHDPNCMRVHE